jgi:uncharacterized protein YbjQ (UPF0145 family)
MADAEADLDRAQEESQARIEAGGIPLAAERRLSELRGDGARGATFTSDLSVSGFALCHKLGLQPLSQVMGSSIYQVGYQGASWPMMMGGSVLTELGVLSQAWNEVRRLALNRMELEARHAGADAVVGVQLRTAAHDWAEGAIEYSVFGTAVRRKGGAGGRSNQEPVMTELSVSDYAKLVNAGVEPLGIVAWTSVFFAAYSTNWMMEPNRLNPVYNYELREFTEGVYGAREQVMARIGQQAQQHGASGIVGVRIAHSVRRQEVGSANRSRGGVVITFDAIGTAVREGADVRPAAPQTNLDLSN